MHKHLGVCLLLFSLSFSFAQDGLLTDKDFRYPYLPSQSSLRGIQDIPTDTLSIDAANPFFDDFSLDTQLPDGGKWILDSLLTYPNVMKATFRTAPTKGVATFDGLDAVGKPYVDDEIVAGEADKLVSQAINLASFSPASNVILSFYLFSGGLTEPPESVDSFRVSFRADDGFFYEQLKVSGGELVDFQQYILPITENRFFHPGFQIKFQSVGALTGFQDTWHLDYVLLGPNRVNITPATLYDDASLVRLNTPTLAPFTSIPLNIYNSQSIDFTAGSPLVRNLSSLERNVTVSAELTEADDQLSFTGTTMLSAAASIPFNNESDISFPQAFSAQSLDGAVKAKISYDINANDRIRENDRLTEIIPIDSVWALDDGEADAAFGLTDSRGFGMEFEFTQPDSLKAVWINFVPFLNVNQQTAATTFMEGRAFRLTVWKDPHPDSTLVRQLQGNTIQYGDSLNQFIRYPLTSPTVVSGKVWIGIQQVENLAVGIGVDLSYNNRSRVFRDSVSNWVNVSFPGTLMLRPEIGGAGLVTSLGEDLAEKGKIMLYPNPVQTDDLNIRLPEHVVGKASQAQLRVLSLTGQQLATIPFKPSQPEVLLTLPPSLPDGLYVYRINLPGAISIQNNYGTLLLQRKH